jgi:hypothetical protein
MLPLPTKKPSRNTDKKYLFIEAVFQTYVAEKNPATAQKSSSSANIKNAHIYVLAQNKARLIEIVDRFSSQAPPDPVGNTTINNPTVSNSIFKG